MSIDAIYQHPRFQQYQQGHCDAGVDLSAWVKKHRAQLQSVLGGLNLQNALYFDLSVPDSRGMDQVKSFTNDIFNAMKEAGADVGIGQYNENRHCYRSELYRPSTTGAQRTLHIGADLFAAPGTAVAAPLPARVHSFQDNANELDYGPTIILEHAVEMEAFTFYTLYGHLSRASLTTIEAGQALAAGEVFAAIGNYPENGNWPPHLHFQLITDLFDQTGDFPGVVPPSEAAVWRAVCPDPTPILMLPAASPMNTVVIASANP